MQVLQEFVDPLYIAGARPLPIRLHGHRKKRPGDVFDGRGGGRRKGRHRRAGKEFGRTRTGFALFGKVADDAEFLGIHRMTAGGVFKLTETHESHVGVAH